MNLPNILTIYRIALSPVFIAVFMLMDDLAGRIVALVLVISFLLSDYLDGYFARRNKQVSDSGKLLDPLADKISNFSVFLCFMVEQKYALIWAVVAIFYRDALVNLLRAFAAARNIIVGARITGKLKTAFQGLAMLVILALMTWEESVNQAEFSSQIQWWSRRLMDIVAVVTCLSMFDYVKANWHTLKELP